MDYQDIKISGWYEAEVGPVFLEFEEAKDAEELAMMMYETSDGECLGVDLEMDGEYSDGKEVKDLDIIHYLDIIGDTL
jgi:hypothetical protein